MSSLDDEIESILYIAREISGKNELVFKVPPLRSNEGYRATEWGDLSQPLWKGRLRIVETSQGVAIRLEDVQTGEVFALARYDPLKPPVDAVLDSSRYFVLRVEDSESGKKAYIGIGFAERSESFDFNVALQDYTKRFKASLNPPSPTNESPHIPTGPKKDYSLKEGQTFSINLNLGSKKVVSGVSGASVIDPPPVAVRDNEELFRPRAGRAESTEKARPIYLDLQATTPMDPRVLDKMLPYMTDQYGNPHSRTHAYGWEAEKAVDDARQHVADLIGADGKDIIITSGATESNNMIIKGVARFHRERKKHIITTQTEHKCVLDSCRKLGEEGFEITYLPVQSNGVLDLNVLESAIRPDTSLISVMAVNNETGVIQPLKDIGAIVRKHRGVYFHTDAAQAVGKIPMNVDEMNIDLMSISGHKIYGPKGIGAAYIRRRPRVRLEPILSGGGQERGLRSGTVPSSLVVGLGEAARLAKLEMKADHARINQLAERLLAGINEKVEHVIRNGDVNGYPGCVNLSFAYVEGESLLMALKDVALSSGSACTSASLEPSYVLRALGAAEDLAHSSLRFGIGRFTTEAEIDYVVNKIIETVQKLRDMSPLWEMVQEGLPHEVRTEEIMKFFDGYGRIVDCRVMTGFGFVEFESSRDAEEVVANFNGKNFLGSAIVVEYAKEGRSRPRDPYDDRGILEYLAREDAENAVKLLDGKDLRGQPVRVALTEDNSRGGGGGGDHRRDDRYKEDRHERYRDAPRRDRSRSPYRRDYGGGGGRHEERRYDDRRRSPPRRDDDRRYDDRRDSRRDDRREVDDRRNGDGGWHRNDRTRQNPTATTTERLELVSANASS
ncbi:hypothetical protein Clacol_006589 [Clathrus columnatus]|uniref:cysteine desulfurase n=1 Tax=Clathrus columnatus TaxID=1419009 RepID=A0AAV5AFR2_9AGAM|nr:hypothetical protein Clacol_006589 [Clathrus columnatus]